MTKEDECFSVLIYDHEEGLAKYAHAFDEEMDDLIVIVHEEGAGVFSDDSIFSKIEKHVNNVNVNLMQSDQCDIWRYRCQRIPPYISNKIKETVSELGDL